MSDTKIGLVMLAIVILIGIVVGCQAQTRRSETKPSAPAPPATKKECDSDAFSKSGGVISGGGTEGIIVCKDNKWVRDEEATRKMWEARAQMQKDRDDLIWAARSRVLTAAEWKSLQMYGSSIFTREMVPFYQDQIEKQFNELIYQQLRIQMLQKCAAASENPPQPASGEREKK